MTLPVMIKYDFKNSGLFVNGGLFLGYLLDSEVKGDANTNQYPELTDFTESTTEFNNQFDFGLALGFGKTFKVDSKNSIVVELRNTDYLKQIKTILLKVILYNQIHIIYL